MPDSLLSSFFAGGKTDEPAAAPDGDAFVDRLFEDGTRKLQPYHNQWYINISYLLGFQHLVWHPVRHRLYLPLGRRRRVRMTSNLIMPSFRINLAKLVSLDTQVVVLPNSSEQEDVDAAKLGKHFWDHLKYEVGWRGLRRTTGAWALATGNAFVEAMWDPNSGERLVDLKQGPDGGPAGVDEMRAGRVLLKSRSPFSVIPVGAGNEIEDLRAIIVSDWKTLDEIRAEFPRTSADVQGEQKRKGSSFEEALDGLVSPTIGTSADPFAEDDKTIGAIVKRYYERESAKNPDGKLIIRAGGKTLFSGANPTPRDSSGRAPLPIVHYREIDVPFRFWGRSSIEDQIPDQKGYNKCESIVIEHLTTFRGKWRSPRGAKLKETALDDSADEVVEYTPVAGQKPEHVPLEPPQQAAFVMMQTHRKNLEDQSGVREVSRGIPPTGARSGIAIQELQEADNTQIAITSQQFADADAKVASLVLMTAERYMLVPQKIRILGQNANVDVLEDFTGDLLRGNTQVIAAGPTVPFSLTAKKAEILELVERGVLGVDPNTGLVDSRLVLELLDFGRVDDVFSEQALEETRIIEENRLMMGLKDRPSAKSYQDHALHIKLHNRKRKAPEYQRLIGRFPEVEFVFDSHVREHAEFLQNEIAAMEGAAPGGEPAAQEAPQAQGGGAA